MDNVNKWSANRMRQVGRATPAFGVQMGRAPTVQIPAADTRASVEDQGRGSDIEGSNPSLSAPVTPGDPGGFSFGGRVGTPQKCPQGANGPGDERARVQKEPSGSEGVGKRTEGIGPHGRSAVTPQGSGPVDVVERAEGQGATDGWPYLAPVAGSPLVVPEIDHCPRCHCCEDPDCERAHEPCNASECDGDGSTLAEREAAPDFEIIDEPTARVLTPSDAQLSVERLLDCTATVQRLTFGCSDKPDYWKGVVVSGDGKRVVGKYGLRQDVLDFVGRVLDGGVL